MAVLLLLTKVNESRCGEIERDTTEETATAKMMMARLIAQAIIGFDLRPGRSRQ